jgi:hypothetical protein
MTEPNYLIMAITGTLPAGFKRWERSDGHGGSIAHAAARFGNLPDTFDRWLLADEEGATVAEAWLKTGRKLPETSLSEEGMSSGEAADTALFLRLVRELGLS